MKQLVEGRITLEELADWFGIALSTLKTAKTKANKLEKLKAFADYHIEGRAIIIDKVHIAEYSKAYDIIKKQLPKVWHKNGLDTCARVGTVIYNRHKEVSQQIQLNSAKSYANRAKVELFGRNHIDSDIGELGISRYCWGTMGTDGTCYYLPEEHEKIVSECAQASYGSILGNRAALLNDALCKGEITEHEYCEGMKLSKEERTEAFAEFEAMVFRRLGYMPLRLTEIMYGETFEKKGQ